MLDIKINGLVDVTATPNWFGEELVVIRAIDPEGALKEDSFIVSVRPINDAPKILSIPRINLTQGVVKTFEYVDYLIDVDNDTSELNIKTDSKYLTVAGLFIILDYPAHFKGEQQFTLIVNDGELTNSQVINVTIHPQKTDTSGDKSQFSPLVVWGVMGILIIVIIVLLVIGLTYIKRLRSFKFTEVFLIYMDGLLIAHAKRHKKKGQDSDIFSGMFTAVQDFIQDSFQDAEEMPDSWPLKRLDFGDYKIAIDRGENIYIAAVFSGFPIRKMLLKIEKLRKNIEKKYADVLPTWTGDMDQLKGTQAMLEKLLFSTGAPPDEGTSTKESYEHELEEDIEVDDEIVDIDSDDNITEIDLSDRENDGELSAEPNNDAPTNKPKKNK